MNALAWARGQLFQSVLEGPNNNPEGSSNGMPNTGGGGGGMPGGATGSCPPGQEMINGKCRYPGDFPCPPGQCKDTMSSVCRQPGKNEKIRESDGFDVRGLCRQRDGGGGAGGAGGGGGGAAGPAKPGTPTSGGLIPGGGACPPGWDARTCAIFGLGMGKDDAGGQMNGILKGLLGSDGPYTPEVIQNLNANSKTQTENSVRNAQRQSNESAAARGVFTSGFEQDANNQIRNAGDAQHSQNVANTRIEAVNKNFEAKYMAIDRTQKWLDSLRAHAAQIDATQADREKAEAAIRLGYAQLAQQKELFLKQLASNKELLSMQLNSAEFLAGLRASMGLFL